jgi:hypothetical protein
MNGSPSGAKGHRALWALWHVDSPSLLRISIDLKITASERSANSLGREAVPKFSVVYAQLSFASQINPDLIKRDPTTVDNCGRCVADVDVAQDVFLGKMI